MRRPLGIASVLLLPLTVTLVVGQPEGRAMYPPAPQTPSPPRTEIYVLEARAQDEGADAVARACEIAGGWEMATIGGNVNSRTVVKLVDLNGGDLQTGDRVNVRCPSQGWYSIEGEGGYWAVDDDNEIALTNQPIWPVGAFVLERDAQVSGVESRVRLRASSGEYVRYDTLTGNLRVGARTTADDEVFALTDLTTSTEAVSLYVQVAVPAGPQARAWAWLVASATCSAETALDRAPHTLSDGEFRLIALGGADPSALNGAFVAPACDQMGRRRYYHVNANGELFPGDAPLPDLSTIWRVQMLTDNSFFLLGQSSWRAGATSRLSVFRGLPAGNFRLVNYPPPQRQTPTPPSPAPSPQPPPSKSYTPATSGQCTGAPCQELSVTTSGKGFTITNHSARWVTVHLTYFYLATGKCVSPTDSRMEPGKQESWYGIVCQPFTAQYSS